MPALYAMLLSMVRPTIGPVPVRPVGQRDALGVITAALGLIWNVGALALVTNSPPALSMAVAYAAFGLLPAVFIHVAVKSWGGAAPKGSDRWLWIILTLAIALASTLAWSALTRR